MSGNVSNEEPLIWVMLAPARAEWLEERAARFREDELGAGEIYLPKWQIQSGTGDYAAILSRNPGSERSLEVTFSETLSRELARPVYVLYLDPDYYGLDVVETYEDGQHTDNLPGDPYDFARGLGCTLPGDPAARPPAPPVLRSVIAVPGARAEELASALGLDAAPREGPMQFADSPEGAVMRHTNIGDLTLLAHRLSESLPSRDVYRLNTGPDPGGFHLLALRGGEEAGRFDHTPSGGGSGLASVRGRSTPEDIAEALGVPHGWLDLG